MRLGYTLVEMMVVVTIVAIASAYALPAMDSFMAAQKVSAEGELLVQNIRLARYKALQEQVLHRMIFEFDASNEVLAYKIEACTLYDNELYPDLVDDLSNSFSVNIAYESPQWASILDTDEVVFDTGLNVEFSGSKKIIYFYPTGHLMYAPTSVAGADLIRNETMMNIPEYAFTLTYGNAQVKVYINAMGVLSSESFTLGATDD